MQTSYFNEQGGEDDMEDEVLLTKINHGKSSFLFGGVYDGHGGGQASRLAKKELAGIFSKHWKLSGEIITAFKEAYQEISFKDNFHKVGTTALSFLILNNELIVANAGDSRLVLIRDKKIALVTKEHNVKNKEEKERIEQAGGKIEGKYVWRNLDGRMCTRALGDHFFNEVGIIAEPEVFSRELKAGDILIAATDGVWDIVDDKTIIKLLSSKKSAKDITDAIKEYCISVSGGIHFVRGNFSLIAIIF